MPLIPQPITGPAVPEIPPPPGLEGFQSYLARELWFAYQGGALAMDFAIDIGAATVTIYVRTAAELVTSPVPAGSIVVSSVVTALRSIPRAFRCSGGAGYVVECTGHAETVTGFSVPNFQCPSTQGFSVATGFYTGNISVQATPAQFAPQTGPATLTAAEILSQAADANTGLITLTSQGVANWTAHNLQGKFAKDSGGQIAPIEDNGVNTLTLATSAALVAPLTIVEPSCTLTMGNASGIAHVGATSYFNWQGINFQPLAANDTIYQIAARAHVVTFNACTLGGPIYDDGSYTLFYQCTMAGTGWQFFGQSCSVNFCCFGVGAGGSFGGAGGFYSNYTIYGSIFTNWQLNNGITSTAPVGSLFSWAVENTLVQASPGDGILMQGSGWFETANVTVNGSVANACRIHGLIHGSFNGSLQGNGSVGKGVKLEAGAELHRGGAGTDVTASVNTDWQAGTVAAAAWGAFAQTQDQGANGDGSVFLT